MKTLKRLSNGIWIVEYETQFELAMTMWRVSECRESPMPNVKGTTLIDYMEWYVKKYKCDNCFTYTSDFCGFNIDSDAWKDVYKNNMIPDRNKYDDRVEAIGDLISTFDNKWSLLGIVEGDTETFKHEYAHALFLMNEDYKKEQITNFNNMKKKDKEKAGEILTNMGYINNVHIDETQAYFSTGLTDSLSDFFTEKHCEPFIETYNKYNEI